MLRPPVSRNPSSDRTMLAVSGNFLPIASLVNAENSSRFFDY
jgi:hypothetical protein